MLQVNDMRTTLAFWTEGLGFTVTASMAESDGVPPFWCNVTRDGASLMFTWEDEHTHDDGEVHRSEAQLAGNLYFNVDDVDALVAELRDRKVVPADAQATPQPHGMKELSVTDPNGFEVVFGQPV
jgi:catechol 2,3-dioxygenase-like lactoylglutathione lyase family enzyme